MDAGNISQQNQAVFGTVTQLVTSTDFCNASIEFLQKHMDVFDEADENKLEYTTIFEEYVSILEQTIDAQLYKAYNEQ